MDIRRAVAIIVLAIGLAGCGVADLISNGLSYSRAVETDLEGATGIRPEVGFNWHNGRFQSVTVTFPRVYAGRPFGGVGDPVGEGVGKGVKQAADTNVLALSLDRK